MENNHAEPAGETRFVRLAERLSSVGGGLACACVLLITALITVEVVMRNFFGKSTMISDELSGYLYAAIVFFGIGQTLRDKGFIRVEVVYQKLRGRMLTAFRWFIVLASICYASVLLVNAVRQVAYLYNGHIRSDSLSQVPLYLPQSIMVIGWSLLLLQLFAYVVRGMRGVP